jgi:N-acetyl-alpha-D-muramate 1-phosphate uridylyltransferase
MKAMILAAGLGTRLKPWTDHHPKALAVVNGKSLLQRNIEYLQAHGISDVVINVHHFANQIQDAIVQNNGWGSTIAISDETNQVLETGGGLWKAKSLLQDADYFALLNVDMLTDLNLSAMIAQHKAANALATLAITDRNSSRAFLWNNNLQLCGWRNNASNEQKIMTDDASTLTAYAFSGIHIISQQIFAQMALQPAMIEAGKFGMVEVYLNICKQNKILGYLHSGDKLLDVGKPESIAEAEGMFV